MDLIDMYFNLIFKAAIWSQASQLGPIQNSNFYVLALLLLLIIALMFVVWHGEHTRTANRIACCLMAIVLLPATSFVLTVGAVIVTGAIQS